MPPRKPARIIAYARVSSVDQTQGTSLEDQKARTAAEAQGRGLSVSRYYVEAESAGYEKHERREQLKALMRDVRSGDLVLVDKLDRWSRNPEITYRSIRELREKGVSIYFVSEQLDPSTAQGEMALGMWITFARSEHRRIRDRMVGTREGLQASGYYTFGGRPPFGYRRPPQDPKNRLAWHVIVPEPKEAEIVRSVFKRYASGTVGQAALASEYGMGLDAINSMLRRRTYIGQVQAPPSAPGKRDGLWIPGKHEAIVDEALFERVQRMIEQRTHGGPRPRRTPSATSSWLLRDVATCWACGKKMRSSYRGPKGGRVVYYLCSNRYIGTRACKAPHVRVDLVEHGDDGAAEQIQEHLKVLSRELAKGPPARKAPAPRDVGAERETLRKRRERALDMYETGDIDREGLNARLQKIDAELRTLAEIEVTPKPSPLESSKTRSEMLGRLDDLEWAFSNASAEDKRVIATLLISKARLAAGEDPLIEWRSVEEVHERIEEIREALLRSLGRAPSRGEWIDALYG